MAMLSQELFVYLAMFIQTEPGLFFGMLRLRVGLIIQVMAKEIASSLKMKYNDDEDAMEELLSLSPYEMRNLLHHIMSGREFSVQPTPSGYVVSSEDVCAVNKVSESLQ